MKMHRHRLCMPEPACFGNHASSPLDMLDQQGRVCPLRGERDAGGVRNREIENALARQGHAREICMRGWIAYLWTIAAVRRTGTIAAGKDQGRAADTSGCGAMSSLGDPTLASCDTKKPLEFEFQESKKN